MTFCFPDSVLEPTDFGTFDRMALVPLRRRTCGFDDPLDRVIEAHLHGGVSIVVPISALVLDPSYRGTPIERRSRSLPCELRWHSGYRVADRRDPASIPTYRGPEIVAAAEAIASDGVLTPSHHR